MNNTLLKYNNYNELRRIYFSTSVLLTSGIVSLFFIEMLPLKFTLLFTAGLMLDILHLSRFYEMNAAIKNLIKEKD